ncbi:unnamed protein product [Rotaria socialis]|uniref:Spermatogenesis-associated protein 6 N-terminal domain-containing protein n=1 Tax=Rotaria socialis TaxID=392032 RepID=A0A817XMR6_9BILA|nr:unnamed protein product [Rotaria socialis]CAF3357737.1 unnamed protein product [Rotaria socialis]CAF3369968.1 unnamed protein product [Rotaria socialis]CAF3527136.1 unnamed protein product [Rotaria socialis]
MSTSNKTYKYSVELNICAVDAPGTRLTTKGDIYINICLLGVHQRTHFMSPYLPMHINQKFYFDKIFKSCHDPRDIIQRLQREHVLIELLQANGSSSVLLASYETSAKDFLHPYSSNRIQYVGLRRYVVLSRTIDFPGISPSLEFSVSPSVDVMTGRKKIATTHEYIKPIVSHGKSPKRSKSLTWRPSSAYPNRSSLNDSAIVSTSLTSPTISSAVKNDYSQPDIQAKLRELAVPGEVKYIVAIDNTVGRKPFVVRHVNNDLIGRKPLSHSVFNDGLVVNDYSLSRGNSSMSLHSLNDGAYRSRSVSRGNRRRSGSRGPRARSVSTSRRELSPFQSSEFEVRGRSRTPERRSNLRSTTTYLHNDYDSHNLDDDCAICRLHRMHSEQNQRAKSLEQQHFTTKSKHKLYSPAVYSRSTSPYLTSTTLARDPFHYCHRQSPAGKLSDKVLHTLRRNLESYSTQPWHKYYSAFRYADGHCDVDGDDELLERSRRLTQY